MENNEMIDNLKSLLENMIDVEPEIMEFVDGNFWELIN